MFLQQDLFVNANAWKPLNHYARLYENNTKLSVREAEKKLAV